MGLIECGIYRNINKRNQKKDLICHIRCKIIEFKKEKGKKKRKEKKEQFDIKEEK